MVASSPDPPQVPPARRKVRGRWRRLVVISAVLLLAGWGVLRGLPMALRALAARALTSRNADAAERWVGLWQLVDRGDPQTELVRARIARRRQDYEGVRAHLQRAFDLGAARDLLEREQLLALAQSGQMRDADSHLATLLTDPGEDGAEICEAYVNGYLLTYELAKANLLLGGWERDFPDDPLPHVIRGGLMQSWLRWNEAEASFRKALELAPADAEACEGLAEALAGQRKFDEALGWYQRARPLGAGDWKGRLGRAQCLEALGRTDEARQLLDALAVEQPANPRVLAALGQLELQARNDGRARELLERASQADPGNAEILSGLAGVLRRAGESERAAALAQKAKASAEAKVRAERLLEKIAAEPDNVEARYEVGALRLKYGPEREGVLWLKSVLQIDPEHGPAREALARWEQHKPGPQPD